MKNYSMWRLITLLAFLPLAATAQEPSQYTVDKDSLVIFHVDRTVAFEATGEDWRYPWIPEPDCVATHECIMVTMSGGTGKFTYLANEIYPNEQWVRIDVFAWLDHFSNPSHIFYNLHMFAAREWQNKLYFLASSHIWRTTESPPREYVTNMDFLEELEATDLVQDIDGYACDNIGAPDYLDEGMQGGENIDVKFGSMCARRGVYVEDLLQRLRGGMPKVSPLPQPETTQD
ncbi:MAG: hypothetical protein KDB14_19205 [Planctomycetales bacterium]|nr:hypothetical protein [Planctomycetales bacterium]